MTDSTAAALRHTPLYPAAQALQARMVAFAGWDMAVQYAGIRPEHEAVRTSAGIFDISHMGKFKLQGDGVLTQLQRLVPTDLSPLQPGRAQYTVLLNDQGGIIDDVIIYYQGTDAAGDRVQLIVNAATTSKDWQWLERQLDTRAIDLQDQSLDQALLAVQGPQAIARLQALTPTDLQVLPRFGHCETTLGDIPVFLARTGYTGEDGVEIMVAAAAAIALWDLLLSLPLVPCGLGARDTLRLEAAMALYGQDIDDTTTPLEAGLGWLVHLDRVTDHIGRSVLVQQHQQGVTRRLVGIATTGRHIARHDYPIWHQDQAIGTITSGTLSPTLGTPIALGYVPPALAKVGQPLAVEIRGQHYPATVVKRPFYKAQRRPAMG